MQYAVTEQDKAKVRSKNRKIIRIAVAVAVVLVVAAVLVSRFYWKDVLLAKTRDVTLAQAITVMPTVIITGEEYSLAGKLLQSEDIQTAIQSNEPAVTLDESVSSEFLGQIHIDGEPVDSVTIGVVSDTVYFEYMAGNCRYYLSFSSADYIIKTAAQYKKNMEVKYFFENYNNTTYKEYYFVRDWFQRHNI